MKKTPHLVDFAENGREAISQFVAGRYDLVFMDIQMPIVDGYTAVEEIRRWENHLRRRPTPIIALTASADSETIRRTKEAGCDLHISKPLKKSGPAGNDRALCAGAAAELPPNHTSASAECLAMS
jgi:CheY-like chemotaxis protein